MTHYAERSNLPCGVVVGHGVDVVDILAFSRLIEGCALCPNRHFTNAELEEVGDSGNKLERLAGRFAIKESVMKALGVGWGDGVAFTDVEVSADERGAPSVILRRKLLELQIQRSISRWLVSASHTSSVAFASAIALCDV